MIISCFRIQPFGTDFSNHDVPQFKVSKIFKSCPLCASFSCRRRRIAGVIHRRYVQEPACNHAVFNENGHLPAVIRNKVQKTCDDAVDSKCTADRIQVQVENDANSCARLKIAAGTMMRSGNSRSTKSCIAGSGLATFWLEQIKNRLPSRLLPMINSRLW